MQRSLRRWAALAALLAITLQALWPLLSHARPKDPSLLVPVCTVDGVTHYLELKPGSTPLDERSAEHGDHCKLCVFENARDIAPQPRQVLCFVDSGSRNFRVISYLASHSKPAILSPAHPRAPPQAS